MLVVTIIFPFECNPYSIPDTPQARTLGVPDDDGYK